MGASRMVLCGALLLPVSLLAQERVAPEPASQEPGALRANRLVRAVAPGYVHHRSFWGTQPRGWFLSGRVDLGVFFLKPRISAGYGRAHFSWIGVDLNPIVSSEGVGAYSGVRLALPFFDLRIGGRYQYTFRRAFLARKDGYEREDIELRDGPTSIYLSLEAELTGSIPLGPGNLITEVAGTMITLVDDGYNVYEETIRVVAEPPWVWRGLLGYLVRLLPLGALRLGLAGQVVHSPERGAWVVRGGVVARFRLAYNLELRGTFLPALVSPDRLGLAGGDSYQVGVRYLWAHAFD